MRIELNGPLFGPDAAREIAEFAEELDAELADEGRRLVLQYLGQRLQHPTGYYQSRVHVEQQGSRHMVTDSGVVYGPWLEGTSSRNQSTRFKGYRHWRQATQKLQEQAGPIAQRVMPRLLRRIG